MPSPPSLIRNFSIIAHVDHGKSTLADRLLEVTGVLSERERVDQFLDRLPIERERGITIKSQTVRLPYKAADGTVYQLNLIDTPGHVDFHYEVRCALAACEGALLVVDATQGVEAQTLANAYSAIESNLEVIPVLNKTDLPSVDVEKTRREIEDVVGLSCADALEVSAKTGLGVGAILEALVSRVPSPKGDPSGPLRALVFDSWYDAYRGAMVMVRVVDGTLRKGQKIKMLATGSEYEVVDLGVMSPNATSVSELGTGEVGYVAANIRSVKDTGTGDTIVEASKTPPPALPGFRKVKPMVFAGIFPTDNADYDALRDALEKLHLNDPAFAFEPDTSEALGFGFRCGFLGLLHMEIVQERLERDYDLDLISTAPSVMYRVHLLDGTVVEVENPARVPPAHKVEHIEEPLSRVVIHTPSAYVGAVLTLCEERRGVQKSISYSSTDRVIITYELPLAEILFDFHDRLKSVSRGYASMDYEVIGFGTSDLVKIDILVNGEPLDALAVIVHKDKSFTRGRDLCVKLKELIPRQQFEVAVQAAIGSRVVARVNVKAVRKDVIAKCYGGDISRKRKLLEKQKKGKRRMKQVGSVEIPQDAFLAILKVDN
ncbi:MAG: elongation factor 4 [Deltaproteobacteria bacterium]|nr:elongation factor 4 [Deltaproteobacteria bacterium]